MIMQCCSKHSMVDFLAKIQYNIEKNSDLKVIFGCILCKADTFFVPLVSALDRFHCTIINYKTMFDFETLYLRNIRHGLVCLIYNTTLQKFTHAAQFSLFHAGLVVEVTSPNHWLKKNDRTTLTKRDVKKCKQIRHGCVTWRISLQKLAFKIPAVVMIYVLRFLYKQFSTFGVLGKLFQKWSKGSRNVA